LVASMRLRDSKRMKYSAPLGPIVASGVKVRKRGFETSMLAEISWRLVCELEFPAYMDALDRPKAGRRGTVLSSCQVMLASWPPTKPMAAVGAVKKTPAKADEARASVTRADDGENMIDRVDAESKRLCV